MIDFLSRWSGFALLIFRFSPIIANFLPVSFFPFFVLDQGLALSSIFMTIIDWSVVRAYFIYLKRFFLVNWMSSCVE